MQPSAVCLQMRLKADMGPPILYGICYMQNVIVLYIYIYYLTLFRVVVCLLTSVLTTTLGET